MDMNQRRLGVMAQDLGRPMTGIWSTLTPEQKKMALEYDGDDVLGEPNYKELMTRFAYLAYRMFEGDEVAEQYFELTEKLGLTDHEGFWIYEDEDEDQG